MKQDKRAVVQSQAEEKPLLTFPCRFPIKAMGKNTTQYRAAIAEIVAATTKAHQNIVLNEQLSANQRYLAYTIIGEFAAQSEVDLVYQALSKEPLVIMAL